MCSTGPNRACTRCTRSPGSALPLLAITRSDDVSYDPEAASSPSSITGTTTSAVARWRSTDASTRSGSKRRDSTTVEPSSMAIETWPSPQAWNAGAATTVVSPTRIGMRDSAATASSTVAPLRAAPRGGPVVPLVRMTWREVRRGTGGGPAVDVRASSSSSSVVSTSRPAAGTTSSSSRSQSTARARSRSSTERSGPGAVPVPR